MRNLVKKLFAVVIFLPATLLAVPVMVGTAVRNGPPRTWNDAKARCDRYWRSWTTKPFMWCHLWLWCGGSRDRQI